MSSDARQALFDDWADAYDKAIEPSDAFPFAGYAQVLATIVTLAQTHPVERVLDIGTGTGNLAAQFAMTGCQVLGVDFSSAMLARARRKIPQAQFAQMDIRGDWSTTLDTTFDCIVSAYVWHEFDLPTKVALLTQCCTYLRPEGRIIIGDIAFPTSSARANAREQVATWDADEYYWAADEAAEAVRASGLDLTYYPISWCGGVFLITPIVGGCSPS